MGEAAVALHSDVTAVYWNPAGLSQIKKREFGTMYSRTGMDDSLQFFGFAYPTQKTGVLGIGGIFLSPGTVPLTTTSEQPEGEINWLDWSLILSYGKELQKIIKNLSFGCGLKMIQRKTIHNTRGTAYASDIGFIYQLNNNFIGLDEKLNLGFAALNLGDKIKMSGETKRDNLPQTVRVGFAYELKPNRENRIILVSELNKILNEKLGIGCGVEYKLKEPVCGRIGYLKKEGNIKGLTYGLGIEIKYFQLDYSNIPAGEMIGYERNNRISLIIRF